MLSRLSWAGLSLALLLTGLGRLAASELPALSEALRQRLESETAALAPLTQVHLRLYDHQRHHAAILKGQYDRDGVHFQHLDLEFIATAVDTRLARLDGLSEDAADLVHLLSLDASGLQLQPQIQGSLNWRWLYQSRNKDLMTGLVLHHTPPELRPLMGWSLGKQARARPQTTSIRLETVRPAAGFLLRGRIEAGIPTPRGSRTLFIDAWVDGGRTRRAWGSSPGWNRGAHVIDGSGLRLAEDRLQGELRVFLGADRWLGPPDAHSPQVFHFDLPLRGDRAVGSVAVDGGLGSYQAEADVWVQPVAAGRWYADSDELPASGLALLAQRPVQVLDSAPAADELVEVAALATARTLPGLPLAAARQAVAVGPTGEDSAAGAAFYRAHLASSAEPPAVGLVAAPDPAFAPIWGGTEALPSEAGVAFVAAPAPGPQRWAHVSEWQWCGPLPLPAESPIPGAPIMPEVYPASGASPAGAWHSAVADGLFLPPALRQQALQATMPAFTWYAAARLRLETTSTLWIALPAAPQGRLWIDGQLRWRGDALGHARKRAVLPVQLSAGEHDLLLRTGVDELRHGKASGSVLVNAEIRVDDAAGGLWICTQGAPQAAPVAETPSAAKPAASSPPLAWDLDAGHGVLWRVALPLAEHAVCVWQERVYAGRTDGGLSCLDARTGAELWSSPLAGTAADTPLADADGVACRSGKTLRRLAHDGSELWRFQVPSAGRPVPVLLASGGQLIIADVVQGSRKEPGSMTLIAVALATGEKRWQQDLATGQAKLHLVRPLGGSEDVLVVGDGTVIDPATGAILHRQIFGPVDDPAMHASVHGLADDGEGRVVIFSAGWDYQRGAWKAGWKASCRLYAGDGGVGVRFLWRRSGPSFTSSAPPLIHDGLLYLLCVANEHHMEYPSPRVGLHVYDLDSGTQLHDVKPLFDGCLSPSALLAAGDYLIATNSGLAGGFANQHDRPQLALIAPGERAQPIAELPWLPTPAAPVLADGRLYVVGAGQLFCLGTPNAATLRWQLETLQTKLLYLIGGGPPSQDQTLSLDAAGFEVDESVPESEFADAGMPSAWLRTSLPTSAEDSLAAAIEHGDWRPALAGLQPPLRQAWEPLPASALRPSGTYWDRAGNTWMYQRLWRFDLAALLQGKDLVVLTTSIETPVPRSVWVEYQGCPARFWIGRQEVEEEQSLHLPAGRHLVTVVLKPGNLPPVPLDRIKVVWRLRQLDAWQDQRRRFQQTLRSVQPVLQLLRQQLPVEAQSGYLQNWLDMLASDSAGSASGAR